jgi:hypothetical protein
MKEDIARVLQMLGQIRETDEKGRVVLRLGLVATWYFHQGYTLEKRRAVIECYDEFQAAFGNHLRWWVIEGGHFRPVAKLKSRDLGPYLLKPDFAAPDSEKNWAILFHGGEQKEDASDLRIYGLGMSRMDCENNPESLSYLTIALPMDFLTERPAGFPELVLRWSQRLQPFHGYGGIGILTMNETARANEHEREVFGIAQRFPGLEVDYPMDHTLWTRKGIKGGNWITVLSNPWVEKLGGVEKIRQGLAAEPVGMGQPGEMGQLFRVDEYPGGAMILAGPIPEIGDRSRGIDVPNYRKLAHLLKPIRTTQHAAVHNTPGTFRSHEFEAWLARFDD